MRNQQGQVLLITVMLLATAITVVLSLSFKSTTETQITKLEEENQKALAAAEAGIERSLRSGSGTRTFTALGLSNLSGIDLASSSVSFSSVQTTTFITPLLQKDEQYTFYLGTYNEETKIVGASTDSNQIVVCYKTSTTDPALEITLIKQSGAKRYVVDADTSRIAGAFTRTSGCSADASYNYSYPIPAADLASADSKLLIVRELYAGGKLLFSRSTSFPLQGKTVTSEAKSTTGVTKRVQLFQSYPQIPAEFFVTSF